jgi:two-component system sensor histidine kinase KdpD
MLFLLTVVLVAVSLGRGPAVLIAFLGVAAFDFFFVPPRYSLAVSDVQYLLTLVVMLTVALITGQLTAGLRQQAEVAATRERRTRALYEMARELAGALTTSQVAEISRRFLEHVVHADAALLLPGPEGELEADDGSGDRSLWIAPPMARMAFEGNACTDLDAAHPVSYFPLKAPTRVRGVLAVAFPGASAAQLHEHAQLLETAASLIAIAVERLHYVDVANGAQVQVVSERLRSSILSALSHDLRTPLTALVGLADSLTIAKPPLSGNLRETAEAVRDQAIRLNGLVANLLDMARLNAGDVKLRREWQPLEEVIGAGIKLLERNLADRKIAVKLPANLPLLEFDSVLIERVICNLLENAAKYTPAGSPIEIAARRLDAVVELSVCDQGPGVPPSQHTSIFEMFVRGSRESNQPGVGLGLAICRAIIEAHGGAIGVRNHPHGGACFAFTLPVGLPPSIESEELAQATS